MEGEGIVQRSKRNDNKVEAWWKMESRITQRGLSQTGFGRRGLLDFEALISVTRGPSVLD